MAQRRLFSKSVVRSDAFLDLPLSSQALYFHLGMEADDDGFVSNAKMLMRMIGGNQNDFDLLKAKGFLIEFPDKICVIKHWKINNYIPKDRYRQTEYTEDLKLLYTKANGAYTLDPQKSVEYKTETFCIQSVNKMDTQDKLSKDKLSKDKLREEEINITTGKCVHTHEDDSLDPYKNKSYEELFGGNPDDPF